MSKSICLGLAVLMGLPPVGMNAAFADAGVSKDLEKHVAVFDAHMKKTSKDYKYLDAEGNTVEYGEAINAKKPFFFVPVGVQAKSFQKDRIIGLVTKIEDGKIVIHVSAYDQAKGFAKKEFKSGAKITLGADGSAKETIDEIEREMKSITSNVLAQADPDTNHRKVASGSCLETRIIKQVLIIGGIAALAITGSIIYDIYRKGLRKQGLFTYRLYALGGTAALVGVITGVLLIVRNFRCDEVEGL